MVVGNFPTVCTCPDLLALAAEELGESHIEKLGFTRTLATLAPRDDSTEDGGEPGA